MTKIIDVLSYVSFGLTALSSKTLTINVNETIFVVKNVAYIIIYIVILKTQKS